MAKIKRFTTNLKVLCKVDSKEGKTYHNYFIERISNDGHKKSTIRLAPPLVNRKYDNSCYQLYDEILTQFENHAFVVDSISDVDFNGNRKNSERYLLRGWDTDGAELDCPIRPYGIGDESSLRSLILMLRKEARQADIEEIDTEDLDVNAPQPQTVADSTTDTSAPPADNGKDKKNGGKS